MNGDCLLGVVEKVSGIPINMLKAIWIHKHKGKLTTRDSEGLFGYSEAYWSLNEIRSRLLNFTSLSLEEINRLARKGPRHFLVAALLLSADLKEMSKITLYPNISDEVIERVLRKYGGSELISVYRKLRG